MARIERGWYTIQRVPEGIMEDRFIFDYGEYPVIEETSEEKVFEGYFGRVLLNDRIVSPEQVAKAPDRYTDYTLRHFKLIKKRWSL